MHTHTREHKHTHIHTGISCLSNKKVSVCVAEITPSGMLECPVTGEHPKHFLSVCA